MSILRFLVCAVVAWGFSKTFFDSSMIIMLFVFFALNQFFRNPVESFIGQMKAPKHADKILIVICILGAILMMIGKIFIHSDVCTIVGAMLFSPTVAVLIMLQIYSLWNFVKVKKNKN